MPDKKNRNSREDKSLNNNRFQGSSNNERPENSNNDRKKKFEGESKRPYKSHSDKPDSSDSAEKKYSRSSDDRPSGKRSFSGSKEKPFGKADRSFEKKPFSSDKSGADKKPYGERSFDKRPRTGEAKSFDKPREARSFDKKPLGERSFGKKPGSGEEKTFDKPREARSFERKPFKAGEDRKFSKPEGERSFEKKPFKRDGDKPSLKPGGLPYERKPFKSKNETRKWTSEEKIDQPASRGRKKAAQGDSDLIRLNRYIANAGICSRRKADELIEAGVISVNGEVVSELGYKVNPSKDLIRYNGETLKREKMTYVLLNKPKDYITTTDDPQERRTVMQLVDKASKERIYPVGRLDRNTTGLLLMTNDGDLAEKLSHPRNNIIKIYQVELNKSLSQGDFNKIEYGLELEDGLIKPDALSYVAGASKKEIGIQIHTGKNRIVRRIFEHLGYEVVKLDRVVYGSLTKKDLPRGRWRYLEEKEIIQLKHLIK
ncbi:pseudouridine synthase [Pedobacter sp. P351]|uniref:pseudouridine synthase n=1 Tax=Pedobacter superstes TaxID=3133441 RepID=UPI0030A7C387